MKKIIAVTAIFAAAGASAWAAAFTAGDVVIYRIGTGASSLTNASTAVFLDEYSTSGTLVQSIAVDTTGTNKLTASGTATSEGMINLSSNGNYLALPGYDSATGTSSIAGTAATSVQREVLVYGSAGTVTSKVTLGNTTSSAFSGNNIRGAYTDGTNVYAAGNGSSSTGGVWYSNGTTATQLSTTTTNLRDVSVQGGQLYVSSSSGATRIATVGTGVPATSGQTIANISGISSTNSASPYQFAFADLSSSVAGFDTLYVADDTSGTGGIQKFSLVGGTWTLNNTITVSNLRGLTLSVDSGSGAVSLFATSGGTGIGTGGGSLYFLSDTTGYNVSMTGSLTTLATASTNTTFRGVAFTPGTTVNLAAVPEPTTTALGVVGLLGAILAFRRKFARE